MRAAWRAGPRTQGCGGGSPGGRVALVGLLGDREAGLRAGDGRRARGQDAGTRSAASSAAPGLAAAPRGATNPTPQSGGLGWSHRHPTWLLQALCYCFNVALAICTPRAPPGCPQAACCYLVALGRCIPRSPLEYPQASWFFKVALGMCTPRTLLGYLGASCIQFKVALARCLPGFLQAC